MDANRSIGQPNKITVIFGRKITRQYRGKLQTVIEDINLPNPVIRSHYGTGFIKQYVRDHLLLRTEAATNNVNDYGVIESRRESSEATGTTCLDQRQLPEHPAGHTGDFRRSWTTSLTRGSYDTAQRQAYSRTQTRSPAATRADPLR